MNNPPETLKRRRKIVTTLIIYFRNFATSHLFILSHKKRLKLKKYTLKVRQHVSPSKMMKMIYLRLQNNLLICMNGDKTN
jgi:hypothetical protein